MSARIIVHYLETNKYTNKVPNFLSCIFEQNPEILSRIERESNAWTRQYDRTWDECHRVLTDGCNKTWEHGLDMKKKTHFD